MSGKRTPPPPNGWTYGTILRRKATGITEDRVMFIRMCYANEAAIAGVQHFQGLTVKTNSLGERIGRLNRLDMFQVAHYKPDV